MPRWYGGSSLNPDAFSPVTDQWRDQWLRTLRWHNHVRLIEEKSLKQELEVGDIDVVLAFFQNCYHLRDWIVASRPMLKDPLERFFSNHFEMGACRDICNGFKHKSLTRPTHDKDFNLYRECDHLEAMGREGKSPAKHKAAFADALGIRNFDLFELTDSCVDLWRQFLHKNSLVAVAPISPNEHL